MVCTEQQVHALIHDAQQGDSSAAWALCQCFLPEVHSWVGYAHGYHEDIVQEACEVLIFALYRLDS